MFGYLHPVYAGEMQLHALTKAAVFLPSEFSKKAWNPHGATQYGPSWLWGKCISGLARKLPSVTLGPVGMGMGGGAPTHVLHGQAVAPFLWSWSR